MPGRAVLLRVGGRSMSMYRKAACAIGAAAIILTINSFSTAQAQTLAIASALSAGHKAIGNIDNFMASHKCKSQADAGTIASLAFNADDAADGLRTYAVFEGFKEHDKTISRGDQDALFALEKKVEDAAEKLRKLPPCPPQTASNYTGPSMSSPYAFALTSGGTIFNISSSYRSTGAQAPRDFSSTASRATLCGEFSMYWPLAGNMMYNGSYGGGVNLCGNFGDSSTLYDPIIHPGGGVVRASVTPGARFELYAGVHWDAFGPGRTNPFIYMRVGPVVAENKLSISSDQTGAGGRLETADQVNWTVGGMLELGLSSPLCNDCLNGKALRWSISAKYNWLPGSQSVSVRSSTFGFTEEALIRSENDLSLKMGLSTNF